MKYDYLIVGAGFSGTVLAERIANVLQKSVLLIDRRNHIGGNAYDFQDEAGILVHKYGPHIFHTNDIGVWNYLSQFTDWHPYEHKVLAVINGEKVPVPFNLNSIDICFRQKKARELETLLLKQYGAEAKIPILKLKDSEHPDFQELSDFVYKFVFLGYTVKQWGVKPEDLDMSVTARIPVFVSRDNRYFQDKYQAIPKKGYSKMFHNMLNNNKYIDVRLNSAFENLNNEEYDKIIFTGPIDSYFQYKFGRLPYRSLFFEFETLNQEFYQETAQVNYPNDNNYTRITEFKHFLDYPSLQKTTIAKEYSTEFIDGKNEPYYPVPNEENHRIFSQYLAEAQKLSGSVYFLGRLADYKYYNMDQVVARALKFFEKYIKNEKNGRK